MALINFRLPGTDEATYSGVNSTINGWFYLTDGELWLELEESTIYTYTRDSESVLSDLLKHEFNDYYISRFVEDFSEIFQAISEPLPEFLHPAIETYKTLEAYKLWASTFLECDYQEKKYIDTNYEILLTWIYRRSLPANHLIGGPTIWFFRIFDQIQIIWRADHKLPSGAPLWTHPFGEYKMDYDLFVKEIQDFSKRFFTEMNQLIATIKDYASKNFDVESVLKQNLERQVAFDDDVLRLLTSDLMTTDWETVRRCYENRKV
ncbi:DUF5984 family protein [Dyadobacter sp. LJ53]|uniref:DUF5984 family protein n=1 Tax=Dyadobacter chenwenxiniae TaxID=2906456 RepID=UPI001F2966FF|nr:DUF5984 family protein [Dyadobacter chenwenxiniae]MCF0050816.1 DUF5984 family protein [Dyadobacter chenwenxiniae]